MLHVKKVKLPSLKLHNFEKAPNVTQIENNGHTGRESFKRNKRIIVGSYVQNNYVIILHRVGGEEKNN